ncbi:hypothetical protein [Butyrivibrio sp. M55]|uniref:hypothetical protein n=1 Tax=Butyrivibrio sp. M55 TaxID=1855323 RepID=UPI0008E71964|nr:hypothetical protein [Butyrivibrio sp. M55]SFU84320.1 hypothetical protein SAMN05216540_11368 [Butyrivibrio sp. M55]
MAFNISKIFESYEPFSRITTKKEYEERMNTFLTERYAYLIELTEATDTAAASNAFCDGVHEEFKKFGKVRTGELMDLNCFLIYYIFPAILKNEGERAAAICDTLKDTWNSRFKCDINYTNYESLMGGFKKKLLGIMVEEEDK